MTDRVIIRFVTGDAISAMATGELGYDGGGNLILAGFGGIPVIAGTSPVQSVNGQTGNVILSAGNISGLGTAATHPATDFATPADVLGRLAKSANLSDLANAATARTNLGVAIGTGAGTYAAGDDSRFVQTATAFTKAGLPVAADIPAGRAAVVKDSVGGTVKLYFNDSGTLKSVALT